MLLMCLPTDQHFFFSSRNFRHKKMRESLSDRSWHSGASSTMARESTPAAARAGSQAFPRGECTRGSIFWRVPCGACMSNKRQPYVLAWLVQAFRQTLFLLCAGSFSVVAVAMAHRPDIWGHIFVFHFSLKRTQITQCWGMRDQVTGLSN